MVNKVTIWLTDDHGRELKERASKMEFKPHELSTLLILKYLGEDVPDKKNKRIRFLLSYEIKTRKELAQRGPETPRRIRALLEAGGERMTTKEIQLGLGWRSLGSLSEILSTLEGVVECEPPKGYMKRRGRQPMWWKLKDPN